MLGLASGAPWGSSNPSVSGLHGGLRLLDLSGLLLWLSDNSIGVEVEPAENALGSIGKGLLLLCDDSVYELVM